MSYSILSKYKQYIVQSCKFSFFGLLFSPCTSNFSKVAVTLQNKLCQSASKHVHSSKGRGSMFLCLSLSVGS